MIVAYAGGVGEFAAPKREGYGKIERCINIALEQTARLLKMSFSPDRFNKKVGLIKKALITNGRLQYVKSSSEINAGTIVSIMPIVKTRVASVLFMTIFSAEVIDSIIGSKNAVNGIVDNV